MLILSADHPLVLYGAGANAANELHLLHSKGVKPICFIDANTKKQGTIYLGLPIKSIEQIKAEYSDFNIYITVKAPLKYAIQFDLLKLGLTPAQIINYDEGVSCYRSCAFLENFIMIIANKELHFCCGLGNIHNPPPRIDYADDISYAIKKFVSYREKLIADNKNGLASPCVGCQELKIGYWKTSNLIKSISFSSNYHCNLECIYCAVWKENRVLDLTKKEFLKNFDFSEFLKHLRELGYIDLDTQVEISAGEITLNPYKKNIFNAVKDYHTVIFSNSLLFDKQIADIISKPGSFLLLSLDSGTRQTYHKIKQKDAFTVVLQNIKKYTCRGGNIQLKYIILPENCTDSDLNGFIELCRACAISTISLSCDIHADHDNLSQEIIDFAIRLGKTARKEGIDIIVLPFFGDENNNFICKSIYCADFVNI